MLVGNIITYPYEILQLNLNIQSNRYFITDGLGFMQIKYKIIHV